jgi:ABC-type uncharacterized transport system substrate-binding protein
MKQKILPILISIFIISLLVFLVKTNLGKPRVLILHSYALDFSWVADINEGILRELKKKPYSIRWHYMDTKRHPTVEYMEKAGVNARAVIKSWKPDIVLAIDDNAQKYVAAHFKNDPNIKIVFTGVNASVKTYGYDKAKNATGVLERIPFKAFREVFTQILPPGKNRIVHISDASTTSILIHKELEHVSWKPLKLVKSFQCETFDQWKQSIKKAHEIGDVLLITHYHTIKDKNGKTIKPTDIIKWTEPRLKIPDIGCWGFFVEDGGMMAVAVSPYEQGEVAAKMAVDIIENGTSPDKIPIKLNHQFVIYIREKGIKSRKIKLPNLIEAFARATNHYYE